MTFGRELLRGSLELMVLSELDDGDCYGYQILAALRERSDGRIDIKAGTLYPILHKLERQRSVKTRWEDSTGRDRKWYALTAKGRRQLERDAREWLDYAACVRGMLGRALSVDANPSATPAVDTET